MPNKSGESKKAEYQVIIRGTIPKDLEDRIVRIHLQAILTGLKKETPVPVQDPGLEEAK